MTTVVSDRHSGHSTVLSNHKGHRGVQRPRLCRLPYYRGQQCKHLSERQALPAESFLP